MMEKSDRVYLAGPIRGVPHYKDIFKNVQRQLWAEGFSYIINPAEILSHMPCGSSDTDYMIVCYALMSRCNTIYLLKGWERSNGARAEKAYAVSHGMKIYYE